MINQKHLVLCQYDRIVGVKQSNGFRPIFPCLHIFSEIATAWEYQVFPVWEGCLPTSFRQGELYLMTGRIAGAYERKEWVVALLEWIERLLYNR